MKKELICIVCPMGCHLEVDVDNNYEVSGNLCPRGSKYGFEELTAPKRVVTSTIKVKDGMYNRVPVKTDGSIPKELNLECMKLINSIEVKSPVNMGDIVAENIFDTGVNVVITRNM